MWREPQLWVLLALSLVIHGARLGTLTIRGEEPRRARVASEMLDSGDFVVPRQQGQVYLSRPPLQNWAIAAAAAIWGDLSTTAIRLPTLLATVLTCGLIYWYARRFAAPPAALVAGLAYSTMLQVLELGRLAETEALLTLLVAASLLVWHTGYMARWPVAATWSAGYALGALAGLTKGPQGPVYFVAATGAYLLLVRRDWRMLVHWGHAAGIATLVAVLAAWVVPFWQATDVESVLAIWGRNAAIRFANPGAEAMILHALEFPLRLLVCTLPWSALLVAYALPSVRRELGEARPFVLFLVTALIVTLPSCLTAIEARARYFMPLYPCIALLLAPLIDRVCAPRTATAQRPAPRLLAWLWYHWQGATALALLGVAFAMLAATALSLGDSVLVQSPAFAVTYLVLVVGVATAIFIWRGRGTGFSTAAAAAVIALAFGATYSGARINELVRKSADNGADIAALRTRLPRDAQLVSFGRAHHLFAYYYGQTIPALDWPAAAGTVPGNLEYFCFEDLEGVEEPALPFAWEPVAVVPCDRNREPRPAQKMIVGRRLDAQSVASEPAAPEARR